MHDSRLSRAEAMARAFADWYTITRARRLNLALGIIALTCGFWALGAFNLFAALVWPSQETVLALRTEHENERRALAGGDDT